jgi:DNA repair protein RecN (Recombination protein N)
MLSRIEITDFALIEKAVLTPGQGLLILTGETGAGKSILIDAISALGGERVGKDMIRHGQDRAVIEAVLVPPPGSLPPELRNQPDLDIQPGNEDPGCAGSGETPIELILSREILSSGKSICRINGRLAALSLLRELASSMIDIHGQHDQQSIFRTGIHLQLLDRYGGGAVSQALLPYQAAWQDGQNLSAQLEALGRDPAERARTMDMLQYQVREIEGARIKDGEDELLTLRRRVVMNAERIRTALAESCDALSGDSPEAVLGKLGQVSRNLEMACRHLPDLASVREQVNEALYTLQNAAGEIQDAQETVETEPGELERIDERLDQLYRLKKKYGGSLADVSAFCRSARQKLEQMSEGEAQYDHLQKQKAQIQAKILLLGGQLTAARQKAAEGLERKIAAELAGLGMKGVRFAVRFTPPAEQDHAFARAGFDKIEFMLSANPGEPLKPLVKIVSGGEASRIMLAIKSILAEADRIPVLIFDEIDSGVSGRTAGRVAEKLAILSRGRQVFCITHLAQIAAMADSHLLVEKNVADGQSRTCLQWLDEAGRETELARLLSGGVGDTAARELAGQLLSQSRDFKKAAFPGDRVP